MSARTHEACIASKELCLPVKTDLRDPPSMMSPAVHPIFCWMLLQVALRVVGSLAVCVEQDRWMPATKRDSCEI